MANPAQEADLASLLQQAGIPLDPMSGNGDTNPPADTTPPAPPQPVAAMQSSDQVDPMTGAPLPSADPAMPEAAQTFLGRFRANHPEAADQSDFQLARGLYDQGMHKPNEAFPTFATRMGIQMGAGETALNQGLTDASLHLNQPIEAAGSGIGGLISGQGFGPAFGQKMQELRDQENIGAYQHPNASGLGDMAGTTVGFMGPVGKLVETGASNIPGLAAVAKTPLGASAVKMAGINVAGDTIPNATDAANHPDGFSWQDFLADEGGSAVRGVAAAVAGSAASKALTTVAAPLMRGVAGGIDAADSVLRGMPRTLYSRGAGKLSSDFVGAGDDASQAGLGLDTNYYTDLLNKSGLNVNRGTDQIAKLMDTDPGVAAQVLKSAQDFNNANADAMDKAMSGRRNLLTEPDFMDKVYTGIGDTEGPYSGAGPQVIRNTVAALRDNDPDLARQFVAKIYADLIPARLAGPLDPASAFNRNMITGSLSDKGKLIQPPVTGLGKLSQGWWERSGGGPGRVMWPMLTQPKSMIGGASAIAANVAGLGGKYPLGLGLKLGAGVADAVGAPGDYLANKLPTGIGNAVKPALNSMPGMWQNYLNTEMNNRGAQQNPLDTIFPDVYHSPQPVSQPASNSQHSEVMQWLGTVDRPTATAYIGSKLGPQVQQQMAQAGDNWKAALFNLASDPKSRAALMPTDEG